MKIGILETGPSRPQFIEHFGPYPELTGQWVANGQRVCSYHHYSVYQGEFPASANEMDSYVICGSPFGVYEAHDFIAPLENFVRSCKKKIVGICFGHQLVAQALGGKVEKIGRWGVGVQDYEVHSPLGHHYDKGTKVSLLALHQDQVVEPPAQAEVFAGNDFCPVGGMMIDGQILTIQAHPEWGRDVAGLLYDCCRESLGEETYGRAVRGLESDHNRASFREVVREFLFS